MSQPFRECPTLWNSCVPRNSRSLPGGKRIRVSPATLVDPNPLSRRRERVIDEHSTSRTNHYFGHVHLVVGGELRAKDILQDDRTPMISSRFFAKGCTTLAFGARHRAKRRTMADDSA